MQTTTDLEAMRELLESMQGQIASLVSQNDALAKQVSDLSEDLRAQAAESDKVIASLKAELAEAKLKEASLVEEIKFWNMRFYGSKSEKVAHGQISLFNDVSATAKSAERATLSRRRRPRFPAGGATALWPPALPRAAAQGALDRGVVEVRGPDLNLQRRGALGVPGRDRPARDLPSAELREPDRHRDVLCAERGQPPRGVRGPHDCPLSGSPSPSAASASRSFMR